MFALLFLVCLIASVAYFGLMLANFESYILLFLVSIVFSLAAWHLVKFEERVDKQEKEIKKLKDHLGIQEESTDNANDNNNEEDKE